MIYSEATFFDGAAFAHIVAWEERRRLDDRRKEAAKYYEAERRRNIGRRIADMGKGN